MKRPNKIERMNAYLYAWAILTGRIENPKNQPPYDIFVCVIITEYIGISKYNVDEFFDTLTDEELKSMFPEWYSQEPNNKYNRFFWWPLDDKKSRITALENAIKLLA